MDERCDWITGEVSVQLADMIQLDDINAVLDGSQMLAAISQKSSEFFERKLPRPPERACARETLSSEMQAFDNAVYGLVQAQNENCCREFNRRMLEGTVFLLCVKYEQLRCSVTCAAVRAIVQQFAHKGLCPARLNKLTRDSAQPD